MKYIELLFWSSIFLIFYSYLFYPAVLYVLSKHLSKAPMLSPAPTSGSQLPAVSVVISAFNEEGCIEQRIENLLALNYPKDKLRILIASDGSTDRTNEIIQKFEDSRLSIFCFDENRGKINVLNDLLSRVTTDITVFSDANTTFDINALTHLTQAFCDSNVGAVCGELHLIDTHSGDNKDNLYWKYEQFLKYHESRLDGLLGANGGIYAIRTSCYEPLPSNTIIDDFLIVMNVAKRDLKVVYCKNSQAFEEIAPSLKEESNRRVRIGAGNYQSLSRLLWLLNPKYKWRCFTYISHKVIRWFVPHLMITTLLCNFILLWSMKELYNYVFYVQLVFYGMWLLGHLKIFNNVPYLSNIISLVTFFVSMNLSLFRGYLKYLTTNLSATWQRTSR